MTVRVTVAPGAHFVVTPHPSGLPGVPDLVVHGGDTVNVTEDRAEALWQAKLIRHPVTGALPPPPEAVDGQCMIRITGPQRAVSVTGTGHTFSMWEPEDAEPPADTNRQRVPAVRPALRPVSPTVCVDTFNAAQRDGPHVDTAAEPF